MGVSTGSTNCEYEQVKLESGTCAYIDTVATSSTRKIQLKREGLVILLIDIP